MIPYYKTDHHLYSLKALVFRPGKGFFSPSQKDFIWPRGLVVSKCTLGCRDNKIFNPNCSCGIHTSPNPAMLEDYAREKNSVYVLMRLYGWNGIWPGPKEHPEVRVVKSWGAQIMGVVATTTESMILSPQRQFSAIKGSEFYEVTLYSWTMARKLIAVSWNRDTQSGNPYLPLKEIDND
jgi:hypothetical protein